MTATGDASPEPPVIAERTIQSVERAVAILGFFTPSRPRLSLADITARLDTSKSTAHRYTVALRQRRMLRYDETTAEFTLGPSLLELEPAVHAGLPLLALAGPIMHQLSSTLNETVVLSMWDDDSPVVVRVADSSERVVRVSVRIGARPGADSAQWRVFAAWSDVGRDTDEADRRLVTSDGVAIGSASRHGVRAVAAPVRTATGVVAALAVVGTTATIPDDPASAVARGARSAAATLAEQLLRHGAA